MKIKNCTIIVIAGWNIFVELANALKCSLEELKIKTKIIDSEKEIPITDMYIVIRAFRNFNTDRLPAESIKILYQTEQLWNRRDKGNYDMGGGYTRVLELFKENTKIERGTENVVYCPLGYSPVFDTNLPEVQNKENDILFWGVSERRKEVLNKIKAKGHNIKSIMMFGKERDREIMKSKIILSIKGRDQYGYTPHRSLLSQCKKKFLLCEKGDCDSHPYEADKHFVEYDGLKDLNDKLNYWLTHDKERKEFAENAYNDIKENHNFTEYLKKSLEGLIHEDKENIKSSDTGSEDSSVREIS